MTTTNPINQASEIIDAQALHLARIDHLNRTHNQLDWKQVEPDDVIFHEIPGKPGILHYEYTNNKPQPVHAASVVGPKPIRRLTRKQKWALLATAVLADIKEKVRWKR